MNDLRPYQSEIVDRVLDSVAIHGSTVMQMPTAAGKTRAATEIVKRSTGNVWFICHRREIIRQTVKAFNRAGIAHGVISPEYPQEYSKPVQVASVQTLVNRIDDLSDPDTVIWDECQHIGADSWAAIMRRYPRARHIGLTATPERTDGKGLNKWFKSLVLGPSIRPLINDGFLSDFRYFAPSEPDLREAKLRAGDYKPEDVDKAMNTPVVIGDAISEYRKNCDGKRALVFASSIDASQTLVARFNAEGVPAAHVDGTTPTDQRDAAVSALQSGDIKVLSNFAVFTEGFDLPAIDAVILMRPTKSVGLFLQMVGRGLRPAPGKDVVFIFDHAGLWLEHAQPDADWQWSLEGNTGKAQRMRAGGAGPRRCPKCKEVRYERVEACRCGYEFPTGREVGEFDGVLYEVRGEVPEGFVTRWRFARMHNVSSETATNWVKAGCPFLAGLIPIDDGNEWVRAYRSKPSVGHETRSEFALRMGVTPSLIPHWVRRGLPVDENGFIGVTDGSSWVNENITKKPKDGQETKHSFSKRRGVSFSQVDTWLKRGLPHEGGVILSAEADLWVDSLSAYPGSESRRQYGLRHKLTSSRISRLVQKGLPTDEMGNIITLSADAWLLEHKERNKPPKAGSMRQSDFAKALGLANHRIEVMIRQGLPLDERRHVITDAAFAWLHSRRVPKGYEYQKDFANRLNRTGGSVHSWIRRGMPHNEDRHVHIQHGLEWVRDNTSIAIPPEAWPTANDNTASAQSEAA